MGKMGEVQIKMQGFLFVLGTIFIFIAVAMVCNKRGAARMKLIRQAEVYAPEYLGKKDILVINDKIVAIEDQISGGFDQLTVEKSMVLH